MMRVMGYDNGMYGVPGVSGAGRHSALRVWCGGGCFDLGWIPQSAAGQTFAIKLQQCEDVRRTGLI